MLRTPPLMCFAGCLSLPDLQLWTGVLVGPSDTPYEDGVFALELKYPNEFPWKPPKARFLTKIYHPNINAEGVVSVDVLRDQWSPALLTVEKQLLSIQSLLSDPNPEDPLVPYIAHVYKTKKELFEATAREWTRNYAM